MDEWDRDRPEGRMAREPILCWAALVDYVSLPAPDRTFAMLRRTYLAREKDGLPVPTTSVATLGKWAKQWDWSDRAARYDELLASQVAEAVGEALVDQRVRRSKVAAQLLEAAELYTGHLVKYAKNDDHLVISSPRDVIALAKTAVELSRSDTEVPPDSADAATLTVPLTSEAAGDLARALRKSIQARLGVKEG